MATESVTEPKNESKFDDKTIKLYIGGISSDWDSAQLKEILGNEGNVIRRIDIVHNYAFAFVQDQSVADRIIEQVSGKTIDGSRLVVQVSKNKQNLPNGDNLCFECGKPGHWAKDCAQRQERYRKKDENSFGGRNDRQSLPPPHRGRDPYARPSPYARDPYARDPYARDSYARDPYARDPYGRDPYARDPYGRGPYTRDPYARDPYGRNPYAHDPYASDPYARDPYYQQGYRDPYPRYRERSPSSYNQSRYGIDPYAEERRRLAYGDTPSNGYNTSARAPPYGDTPSNGYNTSARAPPTGTYAHQKTHPQQQSPPKEKAEPSVTQSYQEYYSQYPQNSSYPQ